jgi:dihydrofolate reductase
MDKKIAMRNRQIPRKLIVYIASSIDGYIAGPGDNLDFLELVARDGEDYGYAGFIKKIDTVIMGRKTFNWVTNKIDRLPHPDRITYVITSESLPENGNTFFYNGNLKDLVVKLKSEKGQDIFCDGGAHVILSLLREKLVDEIILSLLPVLLGQGIRLFMDSFPEQQTRLLSLKKYDSGLVQLHYQINNFDI